MQLMTSVNYANPLRNVLCVKLSMCAIQQVTTLNQERNLRNVNCEILVKLARGNRRAS